MPCDDLESSLTRSARPAVALTQNERPASGNFCRSYDFTPPPVPKSGYIVTFAEDYIQTFAGDFLTTF